MDVLASSEAESARMDHASGRAGVSAQVTRFTPRRRGNRGRRALPRRNELPNPCNAARDARTLDDTGYRGKLSFDIGDESSPNPGFQRPGLG